MGSKIKRVAILFFAVAILLSSGGKRVNASEIDSQLSEVRLETVHENMPDFSVYCYLSEDVSRVGAEDIYITCGQESAETIGIQPFSQTGEGINYYILIDKSASLTPEYFEAVKAALSGFQNGMTKKDRLTLITFGDEVNIVFQDVKGKDDCREAIGAMTTGDQNTLLFEAIKKTAKLSENAAVPENRKIGIVITDGEDFSENKSTAKEALQALQEAGLPMYAMAVRDTIYGSGNPYIDATGEFVRSSGGILKIFGENEASGCLTELEQLVMSAYTLTGKMQSNRVSYESQQMTVEFGDLARESIAFFANRNHPDEIAPEATAKKTDTNQITITFSENVLHAEISGNYKVTREKENVLTDYTVTYSGKDKYQAVLNFSEELLNGEYEIAFENICDDSVEENKLSEVCTLKIEDGAKENIFEKYSLWFIGLGILVIVLAVLIILYFRIKKRNVLVTVDEKMVLKNKVEKKHHVEVKQVQEQPGKKIVLQVEGAQRQVVAEIKNSLIVGRSQMCDVYLDDEKMSRQHFAISEEQGGFYIEDLKTTNGTWLNGDRLYGKKKLQRGDKVKAGRIKMIVGW